MSEQASKTAKIYGEVAQQREAEIDALNEQLHDLMVHIESQEQIRTEGGDLIGGTVVLKQSPKKGGSRQSSYSSQRRKPK